MRMSGGMERGCDDAGVAECLWRVTQVTLGCWVVLLTEQPYVVAERKQPVEEFDGLVGPAEAVEGIGEPEGTWKERAFVALHPSRLGPLSPTA